MKKKLKLLNTFKTSNQKETMDIAKRFAEKFSGGEIVLLRGHIGAGKTVFACGISQGLGCKKRPISSSFNLMRIYDGRLKMAHFDLFRLKSEKDLDFAFEDYLSESYVAVIEWPDVAQNIFARFPHFDIEIKLIKGDEREILIYEA